MVYSGARGTLIYEKNLKSKFSCQTPFKKSLLWRILKAMWYVILLCLHGGTPSWEFNPYWNLQLLYTITCHSAHLLVIATTEETREKSAKSSGPTFHTGRNRKLTTTWSVWRGETGLVQPDPVYTREPAVSLFLSPSPLRHIQ